MAYLSLYRKYRPRKFSEILGQDHVSHTLARAIEEGRVAHAYLFTGPRGTGKTSTARVLAKAINCAEGPTPEPCGECNSCVAMAAGSSLDLIEMDAASHSKVEETREILTGVPLATAGGRRKVYVIDEVHMLTTQSFNALLKTLEEPPEHVLFVLATTEAHKVLPTIVSRTQRFDFRRATVEAIEGHLGEVAKLENIDVDLEALSVIARHAEGSFRDALSALDQLATGAGAVSAEDAETLLGERHEAALVHLFDAIAAGDVGGVFDVVHRQIAEGADPRQLALSALGHVRSLLLLKTSPRSSGLLDVPEEDKPALANQSELFVEGGLLRALDLVGKAVTDMRNSPNHRLLLEVALVRAASPDTDPSATGLLGRLERLERRIGIADTGEHATPAPAVHQQPAPAPAAPQQQVQAPAKSQQPAQLAAPRQAASTQPAPTQTEPSPPVAPQQPVPAEPATAAAPQQPTPAAPEHVGLGHVKDAWAATMKEVNERSRRVGAFLNPSQPIGLDDNTLTVEVQSRFHRDAMSQERNRELLSESLHAALGVRFIPSFVERGQEAAPAPDPVPQGAEAVADSMPADEAHDPVELLKKGLGAEVVEGSEEP